MRLLYNFLFLVAFILSAPYYFWRLWRRGNWVQGFAQRFGGFDRNIRQSVTNRDVIWLHAVSVGEANVCIQLVRAIEERLPNAKIVVSTTTTTGMAELRKKLAGHIGKIYYPIDRPKYVRWAFGAIHPSAVILVETEIWPNFVWRAQELGVPLFLANARLSRKSYSRYRALRFFFRPLFASFSGVAPQTEEYAAKFRELGCRNEAVHVTGNMKFDAANVDAGKGPDPAAMLRQVGVPDDALILLGGSTHDGEEQILAEQFQRLRVRFPKLFLVLVPRHFERASDVARELRDKVRLFRRSEITPHTQMPPGSVDCLLVDSTGELMNFYTQATVVFVGKSLTAEGGQNPIEPAALAKPVVFGPNMQNFPDVVRIFLDAEAAVQVRNAAELEKTLGDLLGDEASRLKLGKAGAAVVAQNRGAVGRTLEMILPHLVNRGLYVAPVKQGQTQPDRPLVTKTSGA